MIRYEKRKGESVVGMWKSECCWKRKRTVLQKLTVTASSLSLIPFIRQNITVLEKKKANRNFVLHTQSIFSSKTFSVPSFIFFSNICLAHENMHIVIDQK